MRNLSLIFYFSFIYFSQFHRPSAIESASCLDPEDALNSLPIRRHLYMRHPHNRIYSIRCHRTKFSAIEMKVSFRSAALDKHTVFLQKSLCYRNVSGMKGLPL